MNLIRIFSFMLISILLGITASVAAAMPSGPKVTNGTVSGELISATVTVPDPKGTAQIYIVPEDRYFVLTQVCTFRLDYAQVSGSNVLGTISPLGGPDSSNCLTYSPGVAVPPGEILTCKDVNYNSTEGGVVWCMITGILQ